jgi:O-antigen/teichoic acid export membrane protein
MSLGVHIKHLVKHSAVYTVGNMISKALIFFLMPLYTRFLPMDGYGIVETIRVFSGVFLVFYFFGLEGAVGRFYFDFSNEEEEKRKEYLGNIFIAVMVISFCFSFLLSVFGKPFFFFNFP